MYTFGGLLLLLQIGVQYLYLGFVTIKDVPQQGQIFSISGLLYFID
jgi:hypothetical protein